MFVFMLSVWSCGGGGGGGVRCCVCGGVFNKHAFGVRTVALE